MIAFKHILNLYGRLFLLMRNIIFISVIISVLYVICMYVLLFINVKL